MSKLCAVYKYTLEVKDRQIVLMPEGAMIVSCQTQDEIAQLWAIVDPRKIPIAERIIVIVGTGRALPNEQLVFIGTFQLHGGRFVGHAFEVVK